MKIRKIYFRYLTLLISIGLSVALMHNLVQACAGGDYYWRDNPGVFMQPDVDAGQKRLEPFYYTIDFYNWSDNAGIESSKSKEELAEADENTNIWFGQFHGRIAKATIYEFLNHSANYVYTKAPNKEDFLKDFASDPFINALQKQKDKKALQYFMLAKANEFGVSELDNGWNYFNEYDAYGTDSLNGVSGKNLVLPLLITQLRKEKDPFYKQRLAFQVIRNSRYTYVPHMADSLYGLYFETKPSSKLKMAALNYATDALVNEGQQEKANYYASLLFDESEEKQFRAFSNLSNTVPIESVLPLCKNKQEMAKVYALYAFNDFYLNAEYVKKLVELDPQNKSINDLLVREINKIDYMLMPNLEGYSSYASDFTDPENIPSIQNEEGETIRTYEPASENNPKLIALLQSLIQMQTAYSSFYNLCLAHVYLIQKEYGLAAQYLKGIEVAKLSEKMSAQYHITRSILQIKTSNLRLPQNQDLLAQNLSYIESHKALFYYSDFIPSAIRLMAAGNMIEAGDIAHGYILAQLSETLYNSYDLFSKTIRPQDIDTIIAIQSHPKTSLEKLYAKSNVLTVQQLRAIQGSLYLRQQNIVMANKCFALDDANYYPVDFAKLNTNPDGHPCYPWYEEKLSDESAQYYSPEEVKAWNDRAERLAWQTNNYSVTRTMLELMDKIKRKEGNMAQNYYNLACLYMEISYFGRAYTALQFSGDWSWYEFDYSSDEKDFTEHYYGNTWAIKYYELALKNSTDRELSARCLYALFRCNRHLITFRGTDKSNTDIQYLFRLHDQFANTQYYAIKECWGLSAYVRELRGG